MSDPNVTHYEVHEQGKWDDQGFWYEPIIADVETLEEAQIIADDTGGIIRPM